MNFVLDSTRTWVVDWMQSDRVLVSAPVIGFAVEEEGEIQAVVLGHEGCPETVDQYNRYENTSVEEDNYEGPLNGYMAVLRVVTPEEWLRVVHDG